MTKKKTIPRSKAISKNFGIWEEIKQLEQELKDQGYIITGHSWGVNPETGDYEVEIHVEPTELHKKENKNVSGIIVQ